MALGLQSVSRTFKTGILSNAVQGLGVGTIVNVVDKKATQGKLTAMGVNIGQTLNNKPLNLNVTDLITALLTTGLNFKKNNLIAMITTIGVKKVAEAFDYIDPPVVNTSGSVTAPMVYPNVTTPNNNNTSLSIGRL